MKLFATTKDRKRQREKETRREKQTRRREKQSSFLSYWYPTVPIFLSSCPFKLIIFHTLNSFSSTTVLMNTLFFFVFLKVINMTICKRQIPFNPPHWKCQSYNVVADALSTARPDPVSVKSAGILSLVLTGGKIKHSHQKPPSDQILQIISVQGRWRVYYLLILSFLI